MKKLNKKQELFIDEYFLNNLNATKAYMNAYGCKNESTARVNGSKLLTNANIKREIDNRMEEIKEKNELSIDKVLQRLRVIALGDWGEVFNIVKKTRTEETLDLASGELVEKEVEFFDYELKDTNTLTVEQRALISGFKRTKWGLEPVLNNQLSALKILLDYLNTKNVNVNLNFEQFKDLSFEELLQLAGEESEDDSDE